MPHVETLPAHFDVMLTLFQGAAGVAIWRSSYSNGRARMTAALLVFANAVVTLATALSSLGVSPSLVTALAGGADHPTGPLLLLLALELVVRQNSQAIRALRIFLIAGCLAALVVGAGFGSNVFLQELFQGAVIYVAYGTAVLALTFGLVRAPSWPG